MALCCVFRRGGGKTRKRGAATLESMRNIVCIINKKTCKHILVGTQN